MTPDGDQLAELDVSPSFRARYDAWRMRRRVARATRPQRAAVTALAAVSRVSGVQAAGLRLAALLLFLGLAVGVLLGISTARPPAPT